MANKIFTSDSWSGFVAGIASLIAKTDAKANATEVAYIDEDDDETVTLSVNLPELASLIGGDV